MTINNAQLFVNNLWDWGYLTGTTDIQCRQLPSDLDGLLEKNNHFLVLETKSPTVKELPLGQKILFESMIRTQFFTVVIVYGKVNAPERLEVWTKNEKQIYSKADMRTLRRVVSKWYKYACNQPRPPALDIPVRIMD